MDDIMERYLTEIRAETHAKRVAEFAEVIKNAGQEFNVNVEEAISRLKIPVEFREEIMNLLSQNK